MGHSAVFRVVLCPFGTVLSLKPELVHLPWELGQCMAAIHEST